VVSLYVPAAQTVHEAAAAEEAVPAGQAVQLTAPEAEKDPAPHLSHSEPPVVLL